MIYILELIFIVLLLAVWWYNNDRKKYSAQPPGPTRLPLFGNVLQVMMQSSFPAIAYQKLAEIYGDIMFLKLGQQETVVFCSPDGIQEVLTHNSALGRHQYECIRDRHNNKNLGIIWGHGKAWQTLRRFTMRNLRDYGFGKSSEMDAIVNDEVRKFVEHIKCISSEAPENIIHVEDLFNLTLVNVLWRLVSGKSYEFNDAKMLHLLKLNDDFFKSTNFGLDITSVFPVLRDWFPDWSGRTIQKKSSADLFDYGKELLEEHRKLNHQDNPESFIDVFAAKIDSSKDEPDTDFTDEQFVMTILDLIVGGSETSSKTLSFGILYMLLNPDIQKKVQEELDRVVPFGPINSSMKSQLPYTNATILEMLRYSTILPTPTAREATEDFYFRGYLIKKGTCLITNVHAIHFSKYLWGDDVKTFRPERFLNSSGTAVEKKMADLLATFGAGKRFCLGQSLAETTMFIYFATVLRQFEFVRVPGTNPSTEPVLAVTIHPQPYDVKVIPRNPKNH